MLALLAGLLTHNRKNNQVRKTFIPTQRNTHYSLTTIVNTRKFALFPLL